MFYTAALCDICWYPCCFVIPSTCIVIFVYLQLLQSDSDYTYSGTDFQGMHMCTHLNLLYILVTTVKPLYVPTNVMSKAHKSLCALFLQPHNRDTISREEII